MDKGLGPLLLVFAIYLAYPYWIEFREWVQRRYRIMKRCQYRREAAKTNRMLYKHTGNVYYQERVNALGGRNKNGRRV